VLRQLLFTTIGLIVISSTLEAKEYLKEKVLRPLYWGMSVEDFKKSYPEADSIVEAKPNYLTQMYFPFHGHVGPTGFVFSTEGLFRIVISFVFRIEDKTFSDRDILKKSKLIFKKLKSNYGKPTLYSPWDGNMFEYIWNQEETLIIFYWDGSSGWSAQFRSKDLDPEAQSILEYMEKRLKSTIE
jgi:hypothetical protein